jgi:hypothetical protein
MALNIFFIYMMFKKKFNSKCLIFLIPFLIVLLPHLIWLTENNFISINYALHRTGLEESTFLNHLYYPIIFLAKQIGIMVPFFIMLLFIVSKFKYKINLKDKKLIFLIIINIVPLLLIFLTSFFLGARIRTMWMTPFYLFSGILCVYIFQTKIYRERFKYFLNVFLFLFILFPSIYIYHSISKKDQKTDYPGKEIAQLIQTKWDNAFSNEIEIVFGNVWEAGNLSYHLKSKPEWTGGWWHGIKEIPENTDGGIIVIGDYDENILVNKTCTISNTLSYVVLLQLKNFNHNVCMIGKK